MPPLTFISPELVRPLPVAQTLHINASRLECLRGVCAIKSTSMIGPRLSQFEATSVDLLGCLTGDNRTAEHEEHEGEPDKATAVHVLLRRSGLSRWVLHRWVLRRWLHRCIGKCAASLAAHPYHHADELHRLGGWVG